jgi:hypothetical protein
MRIRYPEASNQNRPPAQQRPHTTDLQPIMRIRNPGSAESTWQSPTLPLGHDTQIGPGSPI